MSSNDVGSYELKRSSCEMQMEECSATLARSTSDGSADYSYYRHYYCYLWAAAAAADPSWDGMSGERESRGILCEHIE